MTSLKERLLYKKVNVSPKEYWYQNVVFHMCKDIHVPWIVEYSHSRRELTMNKIPYMCLADQYGENWDDLPRNIQQEVIRIIQSLYRAGIVYPDITGYNFIQYNNQIWIIDFEHAFSHYIGDLTSRQREYLDFVESHFIFHSYNATWNPEFA